MRLTGGCRVLARTVKSIRQRWREKIRNTQVNFHSLPEHIGIIMDGNGRWAKKRGLPRSAGHRAGAKTLKEIISFCGKIGIKIVTVYAFSTENWKRPKKEVEELMNLLEEYLKQAEKELGGKNVVIRIIGNLDTLPAQIRSQVIKTQKMTQNNTGLILNIALNYGGRDEIIHAVKQIANEVKCNRLNVQDIDEKRMSKYMYTGVLKDPDLIIRPSGELRLSNFLLWQSAYTELWFSSIYWPDFSSADMLAAICDYQKRNRRFGGI